LAGGSGIGIATACRYVHEVVELLLPRLQTCTIEIKRYLLVAASLRVAGIATTESGKADTGRSGSRRFESPGRSAGQAAAYVDRAGFAVVFPAEPRPPLKHSLKRVK
jgi:hypothetical protein